MKQGVISLFIPAIAILFGILISHQETQAQQATLIRKAEKLTVVPSIASQMENGTFIPATSITKTVNPKRRDANKAVPGKGLPKGNDPLWDSSGNTTKIKTTGPILTFQAASSNVTPTDPTGAVGPDHYLNSWNSAFRIWDKEGNALTDAASLATIFPGQSMGDPIVMYDQVADRFVVTQFYANGFLVAISQDEDPVNSGWYTYQFATNSFPDYPKFSLWSDGYYITANKNSGSAQTSEVVFALERDKMLIGDDEALMIGFPLPNISTSGFFSPLGFNVNGQEMPPSGNAPIVYMQDDSWSGVSDDHLKLWLINVDWEAPENSTIDDPQIIETEAFDGLFDGGSFSNLPQPSGPDIDALQATIMYMAQYRRFSNHNTVVFNFVVDLDGSGDYAGIRWYELRQEDDDEDWAIYQEGTYSQPDGHSAFSGNMCMDIDGNIALAYTIVSEDQYPSLRYTGRYNGDPLGEMTIAEETIADGTQSDPSFRYGDYSQMTIDPVDDKTFWSIGEYFTGGSRKNQVGAFKLAPDLDHDVGIYSLISPQDGILSDEEPIVVKVRNYGIETQTEFPISLQINGGEMISETFTGSLASYDNAEFTFSATGDFSLPGTSYILTISTSLPGDENTSNDTVLTSVNHLYADDLGVIEILSPVSGSDLSTDEAVSILIHNYGAVDQSGFEVSYILNDEDIVTEEIPTTLESEANMEFTFATPGDFSGIMDHSLVVHTSLQNDQYTGNDTLTTVITNTLCQPELLCEYGVGIYELQLAGINNVSGCDPNGYGNYSNLVADLFEGTSHDLTITTEYGNVYVKVWIDFNDNFIFEEEEIVVNDFVIAPGQSAGLYTETMQLIVPEDVTLGEHLMRVKTNYSESVPMDACEETFFGEAEDYTASIEAATGIQIQSTEVNDLLVYSPGNKHFNMSFKAVQLREPLTVRIMNLQGQTLIQNRINPANGQYLFDFDMSYAPSGVYLLRLGNESFGKIKRFIVE